MVAGPLALFVDLIAELVGLLTGVKPGKIQISLERCHCWVSKCQPHQLKSLTLQAIPNQAIQSAMGRRVKLAEAKKFELAIVAEELKASGHFCC